MVNFIELHQTYKHKKVLITGHTGFKGAWLLKVLSVLGAEIKGYALAPKTKDDLFNLINGSNICNSIIADIRDKERFEKEILNFEPDFVFHLAAQPLVRLSYEIPNETFEVNVIGTANLLDSVKKLKNKCSVVIITTDKVYFNNEWIYPYRENDRLGGYDPYSASKACVEILVDSYRNSFFNLVEYDKHKKGISVGRAGNVIGGGDWSLNRLIPDIIKSLYEDNAIIIRNPEAIRPWQHVIEPILGYLILGNKLDNFPDRFSQAYNFGPESEDSIKVEDMVKLILKKWGSGRYQIDNVENRLHEAGILKLDISKAKSELNWEPIMNSEKAIENTLKWYSTFLKDSDKIDKYTTQFIKEIIQYGI